VLVQSAGQALYLKYIEVSKLFLTSAAYLKIREISFSYDKDVNTKWAQKINIGVYCRNPFAFYPNGNRLGDPELVSSGFQFDRARIENPNGALAGVGNGQNLDGATNSANRRPGIITFGLTASLTFK
jgi:hypothetical protein